MERERMLDLTDGVAAACDEGSGLMYDLEPLLAAYYGYVAENGTGGYDVRGAIGALNEQDPFVTVRERAFRVLRGDMGWSTEIGGKGMTEASIDDLEFHSALNYASRLVACAGEGGWGRADELAAIVGQADAARARAVAMLGEIKRGLS